jgi:hypothetical protein
MTMPPNSLKRLTPLALSRAIRCASITLVAIATVLSLSASLQAAGLRCSADDAQRLKEAEASYFNLSLFGVDQDIDRCRTLQMSLEYQLRLTAWIERCDPARLPNARARLDRLSDLGNGATYCRG